MVGQVTAVLIGSDVTSDNAPIKPHTNGLWPCSSFQGWKWSEIHSASNPAASARLAWSISSLGPALHPHGGENSFADLEKAVLHNRETNYDTGDL